MLARRPEGAPQPDCFRLESVAIAPLEAGQVLLRTAWLSLDPYMRGRMSDAASYADPVGIGEVITAQTVARVEASRNDGFAPGELVLSSNGWQEYAVSGGAGLVKLGEMSHPSYALGVLGMPGFTAYYGLLEIGRPRAGETVAVAAATGAVGSVVGQIAKIKGCRVVGIAGGAEKCAYAVETLGFDACLDRNRGDLREALRQACPEGIDVYFENVGGDVFRAVFPLLNTFARIPLCGTIAQYSDTAAPAGPDRLPGFMRSMLTKRMSLQGFIIMDHYATHFAAFRDEMSAWLAAGKITYREDIVDGLARAPEAFIGLLGGKNFGKLIVRVS